MMDEIHLPGDGSQSKYVKEYWKLSALPFLDNYSAPIPCRRVKIAARVEVVGSGQFESPASLASCGAGRDHRKLARQQGEGRVLFSER
jgi:hypothetical protein